MKKNSSCSQYSGVRPTNGLYTGIYFAGFRYTGYMGFCETRHEVKATSQTVLCFEAADSKHGGGWTITGHGQDNDGPFIITRGLCSPSGIMYWAEEGSGHKVNKHVLITGNLNLTGRSANAYTLRYQVAGVSKIFPTKFETFQYSGPPVAVGGNFPATTTNNEKASETGSSCIPASLMAVTVEKPTVVTKVGIVLGCTMDDPSITVVKHIPCDSLFRTDQGALLVQGTTIVAINNHCFDTFLDYIRYLKQAQGLITILVARQSDLSLPGVATANLVTDAIVKLTPKSQAGLRLRGFDGGQLYISGVSALFAASGTLREGMPLVSINNVANLPNVVEACNTIREAERIVTVVAIDDGKSEKKTSLTESTERTIPDDSNALEAEEHTADEYEV